MNKFLLLAGPSGVGKSTLMRILMNLDKRFVYISPDTTRPLRDGETDKNHVSHESMEKGIELNQYLVVNELFDTKIQYGTPRKTIDDAFLQNQFPLLDFPIDKIEIVGNEYPIYVVYILPPNFDELYKRLQKDGRDTDGSRFSSAKAEIELVESGVFDHLIDLRIVNLHDPHDIAQKIYNLYLGI